MPECVTCVSLHGPPGCPASSITADGDPICIFCIDQLLCPVQKRMLANVRSPLHSPKRFAIAHLLQGENPPRAQAQDAREAPAKPKTNGHDPTSAHNRTSPHNGAARNLQMRALRAAAAAPAKPKTNGHAAAPTHSSGNAAAHRPHARAEKPPAGLTQKPALASRSLGAAAAGKPNGHDVTIDFQEERKMATTTTPAPTSATSTAHVARFCKIPGCKGPLGSQNQSGLCRKHRSHTAAAPSPAKSNGGHHAKSNGKANGKSNGKTNGHEDRLIARRVKALLGAVELPVDVVLEIIPDEDKKVFVENWLLAREGAA